MLGEQALSMERVDELRHFAVGIVQVAEDTGLLMARLHAVRHRAGLLRAAVLAEGALAHEAMQARAEHRGVAHAVRAGVDAHLAGHALLGVNPYHAVVVLLGRTGRAAGDALGVGAVHAQRRGVGAMDVGPFALSALGHHGVVDDIERQVVPRTAGNRAGVTADATTLVDDHSITSHYLSFPTR